MTMREKERLVKYFDSLNMKQVEICEKANLPKQRINELTTGRKKPGLSTIKKILEMDVDNKLNVNWYLTGAGGMYYNDSPCENNLAKADPSDPNNVSYPAVTREHYNDLKEQLEKCWSQIEFLKKVIEQKL